MKKEGRRLRSWNRKIEKLVERIERLKGEIGEEVEEKIKEFEKFREKGEEDWFSELCFCILTANFTAEGGNRIQKESGARGFLELSQENLAKKLKELGHRFPNTRAKYIVEARKFYPVLKKKILSFKNGKEARNWLLQIKGIGLKEASHFLRNVGFKDVALIDLSLIHI